MIKCQMIFFTCVITCTFITKASEIDAYGSFFNKHRAKDRAKVNTSELKTNSAVDKCNEIKKAFLESEAIKSDLASTQARIEKRRQEFEESERGRRTEVYREFRVPIERTFKEDSQEPLGQLVINAVKENEEKRQWGWNIVYRWQINADNSRSLWCQVAVEPDELLSAYHDDV